MDLASKLKAPLIVHGGGIVEPRKVEEAKKKALDGFIDSISDGLNYAESKGVEIWLENLSNYKRFHPFYYIFTNISEYRYVLSKLKNVKMILDVCHETLGGGNPSSIFLEFSNNIAAFSFSDTMGDRDSHLMLGKGIVQFQPLIKNILDKDWSGIIAFETRGVNPRRNIDFLDNLVEKINEN